jgi:hypothetical protein
MKKWLGIALAGVICLVAGVWLITSGLGPETGQVLAIVGVLVLLLTVGVLALAPRWMLMGAKGRAVVVGVGLVGRILKVVGLLLVLAIAAVALVVYMRGAGI